MGSDPVPAFDPHHPPSRALVDDCVHCGFCLPTCPTYLLWGEEMDSPRGRIHLMKQALEGEPLGPEMVRHMDRCLGCLACVSACPSGVQYDKLIEATRAQIERRHRRSLADRVTRRLVFSLFPHPRRLRVLRPLLRGYQRGRLRTLLRRSGLLERLPASVAAMESLLPEAGSVRAVAERTPPLGRRRARVGLLLGCVQREFFSDVNASTVRVLAAEGCEVVAPREQGCCGALSLHAGREVEAVRLAKRLIASLEDADVDAVVVNAAGCGSSMKGYGHLLRDEPGWAERAEQFAAKVRDLSQWLAEIGPVAPRRALDLAVAYHDACHLSHGQGIRSEPRDLLSGLPGVRLVEVAEAAICCGSAGVYNLLEPDTARELGDRKAAAVAATGADVVVTANPGCLLQIEAALRRRGSPTRVLHTAQLLDAATQP